MSGEPVAIVGVGCHLPGGISSVEALIAALREGRDCVSDVPRDRWDADAFYDADALAPGKSYVRRGGFVGDLDRFDAAFFRIADAEASRMDPQQRMALQTVWHALEDAGQSPDELQHSKTGVFLAMMNTNGYSHLKSALEGSEHVVGYDSVGDAMSITAGRISHFLGLEGPCLALDTACSGSMVATHLACRSILLGECDAAIVVGVSAILHPGIDIAFSKLGLMSHKGRCAAFDEAADGYVRGEGCIAVLLRRQSLAVKRHDRIVASIVGTAMNHDGHTPAITAPSAASQEKVIRAALRRVGADPIDIGYVEAHGTGTPVGDPIEMRSLLNVFGPGRSDQMPLFVGSVKSNFGHLEAGAGLLGLVKAAVSLEQEAIFPSLHFRRLNPDIDLGSAPIQVATETIQWARGERRRRAGVNSFGYSGTNAHAVLQEAPPSVNSDVAASRRPYEMVVLSAKTAESLQELADRWAGFLSHDSAAPLADIAFTAATGRTHLRHRLAIVGSDTLEIGRQLKSWREGGTAEGLVAGPASRTGRPKTAFVFPGSGSDAAIGSRLYEAEPEFKAAIDRVATVMDARGVPSLGGASSATWLDDPRHAGPALFAIGYALAALLAHWGIEPDAVIGHGAGEIAAACVAGALDLESAVTLAAGGDGPVRVSRARLPVVSSVTGDLWGDDPAPNDWSPARRPPSRFAEGVGTLVDRGCQLLIELGPQPVLHAEIAAAIDGSKARVVTALERGVDAIASLLGTLAAAYVVGAPVRLDRLFLGRSCRRVSLPLYPFRRERYWPFGEKELPPWLQRSSEEASDGRAEEESQASGSEHSSAELETPLVYDIEWHRRELDQARPPVESGGVWLIAADNGGVGRAVAARLEARGDTCLVVPSTDDFGRDRFERLFKEHFGERAPHGVIHLGGLDLDMSASIDAQSDLGCGTALHLVQALANMEWRRVPRLWLVTRNAQAAGERHAPVNPAQAPLWGLGRAIAIEHPELRCTKFDLSPHADAAEIQALVRELIADGPEDQIAWRSGVRHVARLVQRAESVQEMSPLDRPFRLEISEPGRLNRLRRRAVSREAPGPGLVEIQVAAAGLNFNDVLKALGMYPGMTAASVPLGGECSGRVAAVGDGVEGLAIGDEVLALAPRSFSAFVNAAAPLVSLKPSDISFEEAATIPLAFLTALYALRNLGQLARGERVLIHAASGGVGLAAVQIATEVGAEIFATAGSPEKRAFLRMLGICHVMDSRSLRFADEVLAETGGRGVDVVLNSLSGEGMLKSLEVLAPFGRFLEIGKRDIYENRELGLAPFRKQLAYFSIDLERLFAERLAVGVKLFRDVMEGFERGTYRPLRFRAFPISEIVDAFQEMAQAKHIGKIVVSFEAQNIDAPAPAPAVTIHGEGTYLIAGGLGGLGLTVAQWMVSQGARHIVLMGRSAPSDAAQSTLAALEAAGARVAVMQLDVASRDQVSNALANIERSMPTLKGIVHAAGIQDDGALTNLSRDRFQTVMAAKVAGAWNLHELTMDRPLDFFLMFSSTASLIGSPGQGNYAAANAFLDSLAHHRRGIGLPALSVNWGAWSQVGLAARMKRDDRLNELGMSSITPEQGVHVLERLLREPSAQVGVIKVQPHFWQRLAPAARSWPFLELVASGGAGSRQSPESETPLRKALLALPAGWRRRAMLETRLQEELARTLGISPSQVVRDEPLQSLGLDSISAVDLRNRWAEELGLRLAPTLIWDHPTVSALATYLAERLEPPAEQQIQTGRRVPDVERAAMVEQLQSLSEAEAERLLLQKLSTIEAKRLQ